MDTRTIKRHEIAAMVMAGYSAARAYTEFEGWASTSEHRDAADPAALTRTVDTTRFETTINNDIPVTGYIECTTYRDGDAYLVVSVMAHPPVNTVDNKITRYGELGLDTINRAVKAIDFVRRAIMDMVGTGTEYWINNGAMRDLQKPDHINMDADRAYISNTADFAAFTVMANVITEGV